MAEKRAYRITGMVQGVGFRYYARNEARALDLRGWVCNRGDGSVEVHVQGEAPELDRYEGALKAGPATGHVDEIKRLASPKIPDTDTFEIRFG